jgi:hypothetical protein
MGSTCYEHYLLILRRRNHLLLQSWHGQLTYARNIPRALWIPPPYDEQVMLETCRGSWCTINWMKSASRWFHYTDILWCTVNRTLSLTNGLPYKKRRYWNLEEEVWVTRCGRVCRLSQEIVGKEINTCYISKFNFVKFMFEWVQCSAN